jgi:hypothetical protein
VLFTRDAGLTVALRTLLPIEDRVLQFESPDGRPGELDPASDTLVLDLPGELRRGAYRSIREWFPGRVVVLLLPGEQDRSFDGDDACRVLFRPFQLDDLIRELVVPSRLRFRRSTLASPSRQRPGGQSGPAAAAGPTAGAGPAAGARPAAGAARPAAAGEPPAGPPPGAAAPPAGAAPPPHPGAARAGSPGRIDLPSRTASPGAPEKLRPDEPGTAAPPGEPAGRRPLLFDWFASHGRRLDEAAAELRSRPSGPGRRAAPPGDGAVAPGGTRPAAAGDQPAPLPDLGRQTDPWPPLGSRVKPPTPGPNRSADLRKGPTAEVRRPPAAGQGPPPAGRQRPPDPPGRPPAAPRSERPAGPRRPSVGEPPGAGPVRPADLRRPLDSVGEAPAAPEPRPPAGSGGDGTPQVEGADGPRKAVGKGLPKRVLDLRTGLPRQRAAARPAEDGPAAADRAPAPTAQPQRPAPPSSTPRPPAGGRAVAGQPGERVRAPSTDGWAGPGPAYARVIVALLLGGLAVLVSALFSTRSPEVGAGEAAIAQVARGVAGGAGIAWRGQPVLDQPPLALAAHGGWLLASGRGDAELLQAVQQARLSSSAFRGLAVTLLVLLVLALTGRRRDALLRFAVACAAGLVAAVDPVLAGAGRVLTVESVGLAAGLAVLLLAWLLHEHGAAWFVPVVGLSCGVALLADGRSLVLLLVPLGFALLARGRQAVPGLAGRALAALLVGAGFWAAFAAWVVRAPGAGGPPLQRLAVLAHLAGSDRPLPLSRPLDLALPRHLATLAVLLLAGPALLAVWRRGERAGRFLAAWNLAGLAAGTLLAALGALDESWLAYLVPGAIAAVALGLAAFRDLLAARGAWARRGATVAVPLAVLALVAAGGRGWDGRYGRADDALARMAGLVAARTDPCSALNAGDPADPDLLAVGTRRVTSFADGPSALASGVRYFLLRGDQAAQGGAGGLAAWLAANGRQVAVVASPSHRSVQLWEVQQPSISRVADLRRVDGGVFENAVGSACGGFAVLDRGGTRFWSGYQAIGGKPVVGRALSRPWREGDRAVQAFDTMVLGSVPDPAGGQPFARPVDLLARLSERAPALLAAARLPRAVTAPPATIPQRRALLTEPHIAGFYLRAPAAAANPAAWQLASARFGAPVSPPVRLPGGLVRQAFEDVVMEVDGRGAVRLVPLGQLAARAGMVPAEALRPDPVPGLPPPGGRYPAVSDGGLGLHLAAALILWALLGVALSLRARLRRDPPPAGAVPGPPPPRLDGQGRVAVAPSGDEHAT